ncbi:MAG TPA: cyclic nucleotide-binding domain-containing protein [Microthrixaceae bacterium]|nr:cyclic nucleotide-binding domain-containing protein [Microthrixaceae bacterium]MCB9375185.1 cyclic nucleotide-binding domain-containing protein [Microthrixaceae bacterium]MCB9401455.1 cyclic nucleotide-binding domain-containing protein [Microthrixaceae bacterium]MCC6185194.1 cyclic nucleotide-binding domain-containing protein [Microthrixaceae bacterium]MCO5305312.1 cyclic nucleotide-binding domain-containing protein [Microthrixaceae bacterium]
MTRKSTDDVAWLSSVPFFEGFSNDDLHRVVDLSQQMEATAGTVLVDQGDPGTQCYVIVEGQASVYVRGEHVASSGPGSMVGEMALIDHRPRTATVVADTPMKLLRFGTREFRTLLDEMPKASERVMTVLRERLERSEATS